MSLEAPLPHGKRLVDFKKTVTSQDGEDGIVEHIFSCIGSATRTCVEFGAWDGKHLSNTWHLWHDLGWSAILIESDRARCAELRQRTAAISCVRVIEGRVSHEGDDRLDALLDRLDAPLEIDLLSIDVDGNDLAIWEAVRQYRARVVIVEYNPTIPPHISFASRGENYVGSSAAALAGAGRDLGYELAACTRTNCVFVRAELFPQLGVVDNSVPSLFDYRSLSWVMSSYSGELALCGTPPYFRSSLLPPPVPDTRRVSIFRAIARLAIRKLRYETPGSSFGTSLGQFSGPMPELFFTVRDAGQDALR